MINVKNKEKCCGCSACYNICPKQAIKMVKDDKGFRYPMVNEEKCINCGLCERVCPILNKKIINNQPISYACYNKNEEIRKNSSSGGIFSLLAEYILDKGGIIYGASFDDEWNVKHIRVDNILELSKLRTSKYLQSNINDAYKLAKKDLEDDKLVLFTGTPCQVNGFISFLNGKKYDKLYTQDIICHGVPSPKVWKEYLKFRESVDKRQPLQINFRKKDNGWELYELALKYDNGEYRKRHYNDLFMQAFLRNVSLRESCYKCSFKSKNRQTDITLADFWGVKNIAKEFDDDKGTSLVIINTEKGKELFESIKYKTIYKETDFEESIKYNPSMQSSVNKPANTEAFFENLGKMDFERLVKQYTEKPTRLNFIKRILKKLRNIVLIK